VNGTTRPRFLVNIIPPDGSGTYRLAFSRRHLAAVAAAAALALAGTAAIHSYELRVAQANVHTLQALTVRQQAELKMIDAQADSLARQLSAVQHEDAEIRRMIGHGPGKQHALAAPHPRPVGGNGFAQVQSRLRRLAHESDATKADAQQLGRLAMRVLNMRRLAAITRARLIAAIPSLSPVDGSVASRFGQRSVPWPEFHKGVDLAADYGSQVRATAAGTVVSAGWDAGGFGVKVDIDHGNGYHTWYAHLSRVEVTPGQHVAKGQPIAFVGSTGESTGPHLHYQVMYDGNPIDPEPFLHGVPPNVLATLPDASRL
jgi:murein DD-endopeptidase MepM/ murein hydrolase activator NlpD